MKLQKGFTLIELMIVIAIVAIIVAIAIPNYQAYVKRTKRVEVQAYLMELSHKAQSYKLSNHSLTGLSMAKLGNTEFQTTNNKYYDISIALINNSRGIPVQYVLAAIPSSTGAQKGTGVVSLTSEGSQCWYRNNDNAKLADTLDEQGNLISATACSAQWTDK